MQGKGGIHMTWDFTISAKNKYLKRKNIKILSLILFLLLLFMLIFIYKGHNMCEIDAATKYKFESLLGKPAREIAFILGEPDKWEGYGYIRPVYVLDDGMEVSLFFYSAKDLEGGNMLGRILYEKDGKIIREVKIKTQ